MHAGARGLFRRRIVHDDDLTPGRAQHRVVAIEQARFNEYDLRLDQFDLTRMLFRRVPQVGHDHRALLLEDGRQRHQAQVVVFQDEQELVAFADSERILERIGDAVGQQVVVVVAVAATTLHIDDRLPVAKAHRHQAHDAAKVHFHGIVSCVCFCPPSSLEEGPPVAGEARSARAQA